MLSFGLGQGSLNSNCLLSRIRPIQVLAGYMRAVLRVLSIKCSTIICSVKFQNITKLCTKINITVIVILGPRVFEVPGLVIKLTKSQSLYISNVLME
jgi:hypothetical protein